MVGSRYGTQLTVVQAQFFRPYSVTWDRAERNYTRRLAQPVTRVRGRSWNQVTSTASAARRGISAASSPGRTTGKKVCPTAWMSCICDGKNTRGRIMQTMPNRGRPSQNTLRRAARERTHGYATLTVVLEGADGTSSLSGSDPPRGIGDESTRHPR